MKIFYSWQSDSPPSTNRNFIEDALERAARSVQRDPAVEAEPVIERDTKGLSGSPDIFAAILTKIAACDLVVADVTLVTPANAKKPSPNPNVLVELGFALRCLGLE